MRRIPVGKLMMPGMRGHNQRLEDIMSDPRLWEKAQEGAKGRPGLPRSVETSAPVILGEVMTFRFRVHRELLEPRVRSVATARSRFEACTS